MKAIITIGIPCSGKSTWAEQFCAENGYVEINRDSLRMRLFNLTSYNDYRFSKANEQAVTATAEAQIMACAIGKKNIVISDTNLKKGRREALRSRLEGLGYGVEYKVFDIEFFDALKRNDKRADKHIPRQAMYQMYRNFMEYKEELGEWKKYVPDCNLPSAYVVDIDGTIAVNNTNRGWYDWTAVDQDDPVLPTINLTNLLSATGHHIILLSGRDEQGRDKTVQWLNTHGINYDELHMRPANSMEKDRYVKHKLFNDHVAGKYNVEAVFDDRPQVCLLWHDLGLPLFKVGDPLIEF